MNKSTPQVSWWSRSRLDWLVAGGLLAITFLTYVPVLSCGFVGYDDPDYVTQRHELRLGLSRPGLRWVATAIVSCNWHPLAMLSLMVDFELFDLNAWGYHLHSLLLHLANTFLLFRCLQLMSGALWRSAVVAALFALHPLHVESVAWISERKDVLSTLFGLLALRAYIWYAVQPGLGRLGAVTGLLLLSLLAKPMWVTFPFLLLLLDFWPLRRREAGVSWRHLVDEKVPLFVLVAVFCVLTMRTQILYVPPDLRATLERLPILDRLANASVSYVQYLRQTFWPTDLAALYPHPHGSWSIGSAAGALGLLGAVSLLCWLLRRRLPYAVVGWCWYVGMLVPTIGLVQVGSQARADRYTYVPLVGIFVMVTWGVADLLRRIAKPRPSGQAFGQSWSDGPSEGRFVASLQAWSVQGSAQTSGNTGDVKIGKGTKATGKGPLQRKQMTVGEGGMPDPLPQEAWPQTRKPHAVGAGLASVVLLGCAWLTHFQIGSWHDSAALWEQAARVNPKDPGILDNYGKALLGEHRYEDAVRYYTRIIEENEDYAEAYLGRGFVYEQMEGREDQALADMTRAIELKPDFAAAFNNRGNLYLTLKRPKDALNDFNRAMELRPDFAAEVHLNRGGAYVRLDEPKKAMEDYDEAVRLKPDFGQAYCDRAILNYKLKNYEAARSDLQRGQYLGGTPDPPFLEEMRSAGGASKP